MKWRRRRIGRRILSFLLSLAMVVSLLPEMAQTVKAEEPLQVTIRRYKDDAYWNENTKHWYKKGSTTETVDVYAGQMLYADVSGGDPDENYEYCWVGTAGGSVEHKMLNLSLPNVESSGATEHPGFEFDVDGDDDDEEFELLNNDHDSYFNKGNKYAIGYNWSEEYFTNKFNFYIQTEDENDNNRMKIGGIELESSYSDSSHLELDSTLGGLCALLLQGEEVCIADLLKRAGVAHVDCTDFLIESANSSSAEIQVGEPHNRDAMVSASSSGVSGNVVYVCSGSSTGCHFHGSQSEYNATLQVYVIGAEATPYSDAVKLQLSGLPSTNNGSTVCSIYTANENELIQTIRVEGIDINGNATVIFKGEGIEPARNYNILIVANADLSVTGSRMQTVKAVMTRVSGHNIPETLNITDHPHNLEWTYGDTTPRTLSVTATTTNSGNLTYRWYSNTTNSNSSGNAIENASGNSYIIPSSTATGAGTYYYYCVVTNTKDSVTDTEKSNVATVTVNPKTVNLTWQNPSFTYDGSGHVPTATVNNLESGDSCTVTVSGEATNAASHTATATALSNANYKLPADPTTTFTIAPKEVGLTWNNTTFTYDGQSHKPTATATGLILGDTCAVNVTGDQTNASDTAYTATAASLSNPNYKLPAANTQSFTITKRPITIKAKDQTVQLNSSSIATGTDQVAITSGPLASGDSLMEVTVSTTTSLNAPTTGVITASGAVIKNNNGNGSDVTSNYDIAYEGGTLTVNGKLTASMNAPVALNPTYNGEEQPLVSSGDATGGEIWYAIGDGTGKQPADSQFSTTVPAAKDAGDYQVWYRLKGDATHNDIAPVAITAKILPKDLSASTITLASGQLNYNNQQQSPSIAQVVLEQVILDAATDYNITSGNAGRDPGTYTLTIEGKGNYTGTAAQTWKIQPIPMTGITAENVTVTYDGTSHGITVSGAPEGAVIKYGTSEGTYPENSPLTFMSGGEHTVYFKISRTGYNDYMGSAKVTIQKKALTVAAENKTRAYGSSNPALTYTVSGLASADAKESVLTGTLSCTATEASDAGGEGYAITQGSLTLAEAHKNDYEISFTGGKLTVEPKEVGLTWGDTNLTYNGQNQKPTVTMTGIRSGDDCTVTVSGEAKFVGGEGAYTAEAILSGGKKNNYKLPNHKTTAFTVGKRAITLKAKNQTVGLNAASIADGAGQVEITDGSLASGDSLTGASVSTTAPLSTPTTTGVITASNAVIKNNNGSGTDVTGNYAITYAEGTLTVNDSQTASVTAPEVRTLTYNGQEQELVTKGTATGGELQYASGDGSETAPAEGAFSTTVPKAVNAGKYQVWYRVKGVADHEDLAPAALAPEILPKDLSASTITLASGELVYNSAQQSPSITKVVLDQVTLADGQDYTIASGNAGKEPGTYTLTIAGKGNYTGTATVSWKIKSNSMEEVTAADVTVTYDSNPHGITISNVPEGAVIKYGASEGSYTMDSPLTFTSGGEHTVYFRISKTGYEDYTGSARVTIGKKTLTVTAENKTRTYGSSNPALTYTVGGLAGTDTADSVLTGTLSCVAEEASPAGGEGYAVAQGSLALTETHKNNYEISFTGAILTVEPKEVGLTWGGTTFTYDGKKHKPTVSTTDIISGDDCALTVSGEAVHANSTPYTAEAVLSGNSSANYKLPDEKTRTFTIAPRAITLQAKNQTVGLNASSIADGTGQVEITAGTLATGDSLTGVTVSTTAPLDTPTTTGVITVSGAVIRNQSGDGDDVTGNYEITYTNGTLTVNSSQTASVTAPLALTLTYNGEEQELVTKGTATGGELQYASGDGSGTAPADGAFSTTVPKAVNAGKYQVWYRVKGDADHEDIAAEALDPEILPKDLSASAITLASDELDYNDGQQSPSITQVVLDQVTLAAEQDYTIASGNAGKDPGTYTLTIEGKGNYTGTASAAWKIIPVSMTGIAAENVTVTYDGSPHGITISGTPEGAVIKYGASEGSYTMDTPLTFTSGGEHSVYFQISRTGYENYTRSAKVTIRKRTLTVTAENKTRTYGMNNPALTYKAGGLAGTDEENSVLTGTLACAADNASPVAEDGYAITQGSLSLAEAHKDNYELSFTGGRLTITKASQGAPEKGKGYEISGTNLVVDTESVHQVGTVNCGTHYELFDGTTIYRNGSVPIDPEKTYYVRWGEGTNYTASAYTEISTEVGITVLASPENMGSADATGLTDGRCRIGNSVTVRADAAEGYEFTGWKDAERSVVSTNPVYTFTAARTLTLTAFFKPKDKVVAEVPAAADFVYDGSLKRGVVDGEGYTLSGTAEAIHAGTYVVTVKLAEGYDLWEDGTTEEKKLSWRIEKASQKAPVVTVSGDALCVELSSGNAVRYSANREKNKAEWTSAEATIAGLLPGTYYFYREGDRDHFDSPETVVVVTIPTLSVLTMQPSALTENGAVFNAVASPRDYIRSVYVESVWFQYKEKGAQEWTKTPKTMVTDGNQFDQEITGLKADTDYVYQAVMTQKGITSTSDIEGNIIPFHTIKHENTGTIGIIIRDDNEKKKEPIVSVEEGNDVIASCEPDASGEAKFYNLPDGNYNVVVRTKDGDYTETRMIEIKDGSAVWTVFTIPAGKLATVVKIKTEDTPKAAVEGLNELLTTEDKDRAAVGSQDVEVKLEVEKKDPDGADGAEEIKELLGEKEEIDAFLDLSLFKTTTDLDADGNVTSVETKDIGPANKKVIEIAIPYAKAKTVKLKMYRFHNKLAQLLKALTNRPTSFSDGTFFVDRTAGYIFLYASGFSTYAISEVSEDSGKTDASGDPEPSSESEIPEASEIPSASEVPEASEIPSASEVPEASEIPSASEVPEASEIPSASEVPEASEIPSASEVPEASEIPSASEVPEASEIPSASEVPEASEIPSASEVPEASETTAPTEAPVTPKTYTVTFKANSGTGKMAAQTITGTAKLKANAFVRSGYKFTGWNTKKNGKGKAYANKATITLTSSVTLYAQWKKQTYKVTFKANSGTGKMAVQKITGKTKLKANAFVRSGYKFTGWNTKKNGKGKAYANKATITLTSSVTLYAQWKKLAYKVTFQANGGTGKMTAQKFTGKAKLKANAFVRSGYKFTGWNTKANGKGTAYVNKEKLAPTASMKLYAQWKPTAVTIKKETKLDMNKGLVTTHNGDNIVVLWGKASLADRYKIYATYCGDYSFELIRTVKSGAKLEVTFDRLKGKKIDRTKHVKLYVLAEQAVKKGKKTEYKKLGKTIMAHIVGKDNQAYSNAKSIQLAKDSYTLKAGKKEKVKAATILEYPGRKQLSDIHAEEFRYATTDKKVAYVDKYGRIVAVKKGTCSIYVFARNGLAEEIKVKVQ